MRLSTACTTESFVNDHYTADWRRQRLVWGVSQQKVTYFSPSRGKQLEAGALWQISATPDSDRWWAVAKRHAEYLCPSTLHRFFSQKKKSYRACSEEVDTIPWVVQDVDYHEAPKKKPTANQIFGACLDLDFLPTVILETPRGYHLWWKLTEPIIVRWTENPATGAWAPRSEALAAVAWWRDISYALCRALLAQGLPADPAAAGQPARLFRKPTRSNMVYTMPLSTYSLIQMDDRVRPYKGVRRQLTVGGVRITALLDALEEIPGVAEGHRNAMCWKIAAAALAATNGDAPTAWRVVRNWSSRCVPAYPQGEAQSTFNSILRRYRQGRVFSMPNHKGLFSRSEAARNATRHRSLVVQEAVTGAMEAMVAEGYPDPRRNVSEIARRAQVTRNSVYRLINLMQNQSNC